MERKHPERQEGTVMIFRQDSYPYQAAVKSFLPFRIALWDKSRKMCARKRIEASCILQYGRLHRILRTLL